MINLRTAGGDSRQVTVPVTITASGHQLPSLVVFKGKSIYFCTVNTVSNIMVDCCIITAGIPIGTITHREFPTLPVVSIYRLNKKGVVQQADHAQLDQACPCLLCCNGAARDHPHSLLGPV